MARSCGAGGLCSGRDRTVTGSGLRTSERLTQPSGCAHGACESARGSRVKGHLLRRASRRGEVVDAEPGGPGYHGETNPTDLRRVRRPGHRSGTWIMLHQPPITRLPRAPPPHGTAPRAGGCACGWAWRLETQIGGADSTLCGTVRRAHQDLLELPVAIEHVYDVPIRTGMPPHVDRGD